jgi:hypothetical protein
MPLGKSRPGFFAFFCIHATPQGNEENLSVTCHTIQPNSHDFYLQKKKYIIKEYQLGDTIFRRNWLWKIMNREQKGD